MTRSRKMCRMMVWITVCLAAALRVGSASSAEFKYEVTWVGNSGGSANDDWVQHEARTLFVAPDGTCFLNTIWEEGGSQAGIYKDGKVVAKPPQLHGWGNAGGNAVVANDKYIWIAQRKELPFGGGPEQVLVAVGL